jgi:tetratricopeptide (TPR) repeat protein
MELEEPAKVAAALEPLTEESTRTTPEVLYMLGETAYKAGDFEKAASAYKELRVKYPDSPFVPDAVEGLGYIEENALRYDEARAFYQEIIDNWPESFAAKRQQFNIGRCLERGGDANAAIEAYRAQTLTFPNSRVAMAAQTELERLQRELGLDVTETEGVSDIQQMLQDVTEAGQAVTPDPEAGAEAAPADSTATPEADDSALKLTLPDMEIVDDEVSVESTAPTTEGDSAETP